MEVDLNLRWRTAFVKSVADSGLNLDASEAQRVAREWFRSSALLDPEDAAWMYVVSRVRERMSEPPE